MRPVPVAGAHPVGREDELEALAGFLDPDSLPRAAVLAGEAGIGKTTVWLTAGEAAVRRGFRVLASRPSESETAFSFATLGSAARCPGARGRAKCK
jgi:hypothetical protein